MPDGPERSGRERFGLIESRIMRYRIVALALLAVMVAGCGSSTPTTHEPTWQELEAQAHALSRQSEAVERAEGKNPAKTRERREARESREQEAFVHKVQANSARAARSAEAQEHRTLSEIQARQEAEENAPSSHHYPSSVRAGFLHGCEHSTGHEDSACKCALKRIEAKVPLGRYRENEREVVAGRPLSLIYSVEYGYCVGSEAVG